MRRGRPGGRPRRVNHDLDAFDREALEIGGGIFGIENLAVEEGLLAARGRGRDVGGGNAERLGGFAPHVLAVDLLDQRLGVGVGSNLPQRMSSVMNQRSWLWNG